MDTYGIKKPIRWVLQLIETNQFGGSRDGGKYNERQLEVDSVGLDGLIGCMDWTE